MIALEFSRPISIDRLGYDDRIYDIEASADECSALSTRYGILTVHSLKARLRLKRVAGGSQVRLEGRFFADVVQSCVVSLEPVPAHLEEDFVMAFATEQNGDSDEVVVALDDEDPPDPIENGIIDIGEAAAEHLALALDPFPRAPSAIFEGAVVGDPEPMPVKANPFSALAALKKK
jgi:uncharacterized metal-binding protein YceD (DUF177 family)